MNKKTRIEEKIEERISALKIPLHNYDLFYDFKEIGKSRFGIPVYKSKWKKRNFAVVHKSLNIDTIMDDITLKRLITEIQHLQKVGFHENVINFYGITKDPHEGGFYNIIQLFASDGNLRNFLDENFSNLKWTDKSRIAMEVSNGLMFLHEKNIIHQDIVKFHEYIGSRRKNQNRKLWFIQNYEC